MLIIPIEKRFDWKRPPTVLALLVLLNCLVFILFQRGDEAALYRALSVYEQHDYLDVEWPVFEDFLSQRGELKTLEAYRQLYTEENFTLLAIQLLRRQDFYDYLKVQHYQLFNYQQAVAWATHREAIHHSIQRVTRFDFGLTPSEFKPLSLISHQFLHADVMHLAGNMFFLIIFGFAVEASIGHWRFLLFYLLSGAAGGALFSALNLSSQSQLIGASGAISGVMAMYVAAFQLKKIEFFYWLFIFVGYVRAPALLVLPLYIGKELYSLFTNSHSNVAYLAHIGGFLGGALLIGGALALNRKIFDQDYIEQDQAADPRQEKLAKVYSLVEKYRFSAAATELNALIAEHGGDFELEKLRYHLLRPTRADGLNDCALALLKMPQGDARGLALLDTVWHSHPQQQQALSADEQFKIALTLATGAQLKTAESIFLRLQDAAFNATSLGILARKLSRGFEERGHTTKMHEYARIADTLVLEATR